MSQGSIQQDGEGQPSQIQQPQQPTDQEDTLSGKQLLLSSDSTADPTLTVVMPTLDEEGGVGECINRITNALEELQIYGEIIVSDSSTDQTPEIAREMGAIVVTPDQPGYGYAYQYAFECARGEYIAIGDADTTYDFEELPKLFELVRSGKADMSMGSRLDGEIKPGSMPKLHKHLGNPLLTKFLNAFYGAGVSDAHSGMRVIRSDKLESLNLETTGMEFASEMIMEAGARGLTIKEKPITYHEREGEATLESFRDGWRHVRFMLLNAPGYLFTVPGTGIAAFGLAMMVFVTAAIQVNGVTLGAHSMIIGSLSVLLGAQIANFGVFATVTSDPIRIPDDPVTTQITDRFQLKHGVMAGGLLFTAGAAYSAIVLSNWVGSGFEAIPLLQYDIAAFTAIVLGIQIVFSSFLLSAVNGS